MEDGVSREVGAGKESLRLIPEMNRSTGVSLSRHSQPRALATPQGPPTDFSCVSVPVRVRGSWPRRGHTRECELTAH